MFKSLSHRLSQVIQNVSKRGSLTKNNIQDVLNEVRISLLEADVALPVVSSFMHTVTEKALGQVIRSGLTPSQEFIKIVHDSLVRVMGSGDSSLNFSVSSLPSVFLFVGFQGVGKTTTCAKIAKYLRVKKKKKVLLSSVDFYRPSGIKQLEILSQVADVDFFHLDNLNDRSIINIASDVLLQAKLGSYDVLLIDTMGCLSTDVDLVNEIIHLSSFLNPTEILFIVDAMLGQESLNTANFFSSRLSLTGIILTKVDGDSRGGAAFSVYHAINKPIKFLGTGEKIDDLEPFYASRIVNRILGMGDILSLIEDIESKVNNLPIRNTLSKLNQGDDFNLFDFLDYLKQMRNMGGVNRILDKLPVINNSFSNTLKSKIDDKVLMTMEVIISSMTEEERKYPDIIKNSRKRRISYGSGVSVQEIDVLLERFKEVRSVMKKISKNGFSKMLQIIQSKLSSSLFTR